MKNVRMHFDAARGWICDVPQALSPMELARVVSFTIKAQTDRVRAMPPGDRKEQGKLAIDILKTKGWACVQQNIVSRFPGDEKVLFQR